MEAYVDRLARTVCGVASDFFGRHLLTPFCRLGGHTVRRLSQLRDTLAGVLTGVLDTTVHVEQCRMTRVGRTYATLTTAECVSGSTLQLSRHTRAAYLGELP